MTWKVRLDKHAVKQLLKLEKSIQRRLIEFLKNKIENCDNPRFIGKPLKGKLKNLWRYRVGDYRIICQIKSKEILVLILAFKHRKEAYS